VVQTAGDPPSSGSVSFANSGWTANRRQAEAKIAAVATGISAPAAGLRAAATSDDMARS
jgi:hypothetical protein